VIAVCVYPTTFTNQAHIFLIINIYNRIVQRRFCLYGSWGY